MKIHVAAPDDLAETPGKAMWEKYRSHALPDMGEISQAVCHDVFFSGMAMALSYFLWALSHDQGQFEKLMQRLDDELSDTGEQLDTIN